jgi:tetratricopeptide (TPR) repeat protein
VDIVKETALAYQAFAAGRHSEAAQRANGVLRHSPQDPAALTLIGRLALIAGEPDVAHDVFVRVLQRHPDNAALLLDLSSALRDLGRHRDALDNAQQALALDPANPNAAIRCGEIRLSLNERQRAADDFRRTLALDPDSVAGLRGLSQAEDAALDTQLVGRMEDLARSSKPTTRQRAELHYSLAQIYRRAGAHEEFIRHLLQANANQRTLCADGRAQYAAVFDRLEATFTRAAVTQAARAEPIEPTPIFVLGMPRSGTTLVEQLLAAHPEVTAGGELDYMRRPLLRAIERTTGHPYPQGFETIPAQGMSAMAQAYARRLRFMPGAARYVTDKTPGNFHLLGLLRLLFPQGRIVHVVREPMDTCFSILQYPFDDRSPHTCDMQLLAYVYGRYQRLMRRWQELFAGEYITIEYERLAQTPAAEGRRLFEHCGLAWQDTYLHFHQAGAPIRTFSITQARQAIYTSSIGAWQPFAGALSPLRQALDSELQSSPDTAGD